MDKKVFGAFIYDICECRVHCFPCLISLHETREGAEQAIEQDKARPFHHYEAGYEIKELIVHEDLCS